MIRWTWLVVLPALAAPALAQQNPAPALEERLRSLEERVRTQEETIERQEEKIQKLEGRREDVDPARIDAAVEKYLEGKKEEGELFDLQAGYDGKFYLQSADEQFRLELTGYAMADSRWYPRDYAPTDTFLMRDVRPSLTGKVWDYYEFRAQFEINASGNNLRDAWLNFHYVDEVQFRVGQFKEPFGFDDLRGADHTDFIESPYTTRLIDPSRDLGAAFHGKLFDGRVEYAVGFFNGDGINAAPDTNDDKDFAARIVLSPWKPEKDNFWMKGFSVGANITAGDQDKSIAGRTFTTSPGQTFFTFVPTLRQNSLMMRYGADVEWLIGPVSLVGEWAHQDIDDARLGATTLREDFDVDSFYVQGTYLLTGEEKTWKHVKPKQIFDPKEGGWGAWELALRYQYLDFNAAFRENGLGIGTEKVWSLTGGLNWYLNTHIEVMVDYEYTKFNNEIVVGGHTEEEEHVTSIRFKFMF